VAPLVLANRLRLIPFRTVSQSLSLVPDPAGIVLRRAWYSATLESCGEGLVVLFGSVIYAAEARIGNKCYIGELSRIGLVELGSNFMGSHGIRIVSGRHSHGIERNGVPIQLQPFIPSRVHVGEDVWVGAGATIGTDVAAHSVVGMGAVVTRTYPEWSILAGSPARVIGERGVADDPVDAMSTA
jgi:virginiamycin A acetyltransferase